jgi:hypothetical protein
MITLVLIGSAVTALVLVVLAQGKWTRVDSWFAAAFASAMMAMVIDHYVNQINQRLSVLSAVDYPRLDAVSGKRAIGDFDRNLGQSGQLIVRGS